MRNLRTALLACCVLLAGDARPQAPGQLQYGAHFDVEDCFEGKQEACARAGNALANEGWRAYLTGSNMNGGGDAERHLYDALMCADGNGPACGRQADSAVAKGQRVYGAVLRAWACEARHEASCQTIGQYSGRDTDTLLQQRPFKAVGMVFGSTPPRPLSELTSGCDATDGALSECIDAARWHNSKRTTGANEDESAAAIAAVCADHPGKSACGLKRHLTTGAAPVDDALREPATLLRSVCSQGSIENACYAYARLLEMGRAVAWGTLESRKYHGYACDGGRSGGCDRLTATYATPVAQTLRDRCAAGEGRACTEHYTMLSFGVGGIPKDAAAAGVMRQRACDQGDYRPCVWLGNDAWETDKRAAYGWYTKACAAGDGVSCGVIGRMLIKGEGGVSVDDAAGLAKMRKGCDLDAGNACFELGYSYSQGRAGLTKDSERAAQLYSKSCALGYVNGCSSLGVLYMDGRGVPRSRNHSIWLLRFGCDRGFGSACRNLGNGYADALLGSQPDFGRARWAYAQGCALEHTDACERAEKIAANGAIIEAETGKRPPLLTPPIGTATVATVDRRPSKPAPAPGSDGRDRPLYKSESGVSIDEFGQFWMGTELALSHRDGVDSSFRPNLRAAYGIELGLLYAQPNGFGFRGQVALSFDLAAVFGSDVDAAAIHGGKHLAAEIEGLAMFGDAVGAGVGVGWHGTSGPITKNSSIAASAYLYYQPAYDGDFGFFLRATPVQLFAANERELLSPLVIEWRAAVDTTTFGLEFHYMTKREPGEEDILDADAWALLLKFGLGLRGGY